MFNSLEFGQNLPQIGRLLGLDIGRRRLGVAISDAKRIFAEPLKTINVQSLSSALDGVNKICNECNIVGVIIGYPFSHTRENGWTEYLERFAFDLKSRYNLISCFQDEDGTSGKSDQFSAFLILQRFLDRISVGFEL